MAINDGPICGCGCGESLPENSTRQFKRGHKARLDNPEIGFTETPLDEAGDNTETVFTIGDAAAQTPDDPEPKDVDPPKVKSTVKITAGVRRDVEGKLAFAMALGGQVWIMADPLCGNAFVESTENIAKKLTPIICQSPDVVKWLTKSSNFILYIDLFMAFWPVLQMVFAHHIAKSMRTEPHTATGSSRVVARLRCAWTRATRVSTNGIGPKVVPATKRAVRRSRPSGSSR